MDTTGIVVHSINFQAGPQAIVGINSDGLGECVDDIGDSSFCIDWWLWRRRQRKNLSTYYLSSQEAKHPCEDPVRRHDA